MSLPDYDALADALLSLIFLYGGSTYVLRANQTYEPLADYFGLTHTERTEPRPDG